MLAFGLGPANPCAVYTGRRGGPALPWSVRLGRRFLRPLVIALFAFAWLSASTHAPADQPGAASSAASGSDAPVRLNDTTVFVIRAARGSLSVDQRAANAATALKEALKTARPEDVRVEKRGDAAVVYAGQTPIVNVTAEDATLAGDASRDDHAAAIASTVREAMRSEQKRSAIATTVFSLSLVVLFGLVTLYLLRKTREFSRRAREWLADNPDKIRAIRIKKLEVVRPAVIRASLDVSFLVGRWFAQVGLLYAWLVAVLSLFESTRGYTERLTGFVIAPLSKVAERVGGSLPLVLITAIAAAVVFVLVRFAGAFFDAAARGQTRVPWLPVELARPTGVLVRIAIVVLALVFAAPLITGDPQGALAKLGTVTLVMFGLAATPLVACALVGTSVVYLRRVRSGDWVEFGGRSGRVLAVGLLELRLADADGCEVRVPYLLSLVHPTRMLGAAPRVFIEVRTTTAASPAEVRERLLEAAAGVGEGARAEVLGVDDDAVCWRIAVSSIEPDARTRLYAEVLDALTRAKVKLAKSARADAA